MAQSEATYVAMHWRAHATAMQDFTDYGPDGVVEGVRRELGERLDAIVAAGIDPERVLLDPGLGFAKTPSTTGSCCAGWRHSSRSGARCWSGPAASASSGPCWPSDGQPRAVGEREFAHAALVALLAAARGATACGCTTSVPRATRWQWSTPGGGRCRRPSVASGRSDVP